MRLFRRRDDDAAATTPAPDGPAKGASGGVDVARAPGAATGDWMTLPPIASTSGPMPTTFRVQTLPEILTSHQDSRLSGSLGHAVSAEAPSGSVGGLAAAHGSVSTASSGGELPLREPVHHDAPVEEVEPMVVRRLADPTPMTATTPASAPAVARLPEPTVSRSLEQTAPLVTPVAGARPIPVARVVDAPSAASAAAPPVSSVAPPAAPLVGEESVVDTRVGGFDAPLDGGSSTGDASELLLRSTPPPDLAPPIQPRRIQRSAETGATAPLVGTTEPLAAATAPEVAASPDAPGPADLPLHTPATPAPTTDDASLTDEPLQRSADTTSWGTAPTAGALLPRSTKSAAQDRTSPAAAPGPTGTSSPATTSADGAPSSLAASSVASGGSELPLAAPLQRQSAIGGSVGSGSAGSGSAGGGSTTGGSAGDTSASSTPSLSTPEAAASPDNPSPDSALPAATSLAGSTFSGDAPSTSLPETSTSASPAADDLQRADAPLVGASPLASTDDAIAPASGDVAMTADTGSELPLVEPAAAVQRQADGASPVSAPAPAPESAPTLGTSGATLGVQTLADSGLGGASPAPPAASPVAMPLAPAEQPGTLEPPAFGTTLAPSDASPAAERHADSAARPLAGIARPTVGLQRQSDSRGLGSIATLSSPSPSPAGTSTTSPTSPSAPTPVLVRRMAMGGDDLPAGTVTAASLAPLQRLEATTSSPSFTTDRATSTGSSTSSELPLHSAAANVPTAADVAVRAGLAERGPNGDLFYRTTPGSPTSIQRSIDGASGVGDTQPSGDGPFVQRTTGGDQMTVQPERLADNQAASSSNGRALEAADARPPQPADLAKQARQLYPFIRSALESDLRRQLEAKSHASRFRP